ncbi:MAG: iron-containing alcohol dehydrogenase [Bacteriovoracaceae bacterium]|jgi:alcohol dehydrogenase class IV|nr:iron-containing alcohol dehydrogenase [Bacteriovoracaceae bacterium]
MNYNQRYSYNYPTNIRFGPGVVDELAPFLKSNNWKSPFIVSDPMMTELGFFKEIIKGLKSKTLMPHIYTGISKNPIKSDVLNGVLQYKNIKCDCIIGLGGGASMDVARAIALKVNHENDLFEFDDSKGGDKFVTEEIPPFITIPTTSGTGSEVGRSTVIADDKTHMKKVLFSAKLMAIKVFADPLLTMELPAKITAATGMDALSHNIEAFVSKGFSPLCDGIAIEAIRMIATSLDTAVNKPDLESRSKMMMAALMGATSFQKGLGIIHSMAHPLSTIFDTHHGLANAIMLPYGIKFNKNVAKDKYSFLSGLIGRDKTYSGFINWILELNNSIDMPKSLAELNYDSEKIPQLADIALQDVCHLTNPKQVKRQDFISLYQEAFQC